MEKEEIIAKAHAHDIVLDDSDVIDYGDGWTIDGTDAEEWLRAMIEE